MKIIGAGMAGLLAANMLRKHEPEVIETQPNLPLNHGALLRFRSPDVAEASGQRFRRVEVTKGVSWLGTVLPGPSPIPAINMYSRKVTGSVLPRSVMNLDPATRWIAPDDFTEVLARGVRIQLGTMVTGELIREWAEEGEPIISTMPMPALMKLMGWRGVVDFRWKGIWSLRARILRPITEVYQTIYYPEPSVPWYRASITKDLLITESLNPIDEDRIPAQWISQALSDFGIHDAELASHPTVHAQPYGKIEPADATERRAFILAMTDEYGIYSLGRFGTWRQILLDDLVKDIKTINVMLAERDIYQRRINPRGSAS